MFLMSKDKKAIINMNEVTSVYTGADGHTLKVDFENGKGCQIGRYNSEKEAQAAMLIIADNIGKAEIFFMPSDDSVSTKINLEREQKQHHISGKRIKGHGGS